MLLTIQKALIYSDAFKRLGHFTHNGVPQDNYFGLANIDIARNLRNLEGPIKDYTDAKNTLIKSLVPPGEFEVPKELRGKLEVEHEPLIMHEEEVPITHISYKALTADGVKVSPDVIAALWDVIDGIPEQK